MRLGHVVASRGSRGWTIGTHHAGAEAMGPAAITLAKHLDATDIYTTAGSQEKRDHLQINYGIPAERILSTCSRDTSFAATVLAATRGRGADLLRNRALGRYQIEIAKTYIASSVPVALRACEDDGFPPVCVVIQGAMLLRDSIFEQMTFDDWHTAYDPSSSQDHQLQEYPAPTSLHNERRIIRRSKLDCALESRYDISPLPKSHVHSSIEARTPLVDMSMPMTRRKRARKACIPCHQRKRKCDGGLPCGTCTTYEYNCSYAGAADDDDETTGNTGGGQYAPLPAKRVNLSGGSSLATRATATSRNVRSPSQAEGSPREADGSSNGSSALGAGVITTSTDQHKSRQTGACAAMAFPHILSEVLGSDSHSKTHSLAYNFGIRPDEASGAHVLLGTLISEVDLEIFSGLYFSVLAPIGDLLEPKIYSQRCRDYYHGSASTMIAFGAVAAGVAALGSFLSTNRHPREPNLVQYAKAILDDPASMHMLGIDHIVAWAMRVLYLRATSRPSNAWIASCTAMHLCEAVGLHKQENINDLVSATGAALAGHDADRLRRIFWISWAGHNLLSYEYDRSAVSFRAVTCEAIIPASGSVADQFVQIAQIIPTLNSPFHFECQPKTPQEDLFERIKALEKLRYTHPFLVVTKAELAFCFYRHIYQLKSGISDDIIKIVIDIGNAAVDAAQQLANQGHLFWNVIGSVFQYACVLLAIDKPAASVHIAAAFKGLEYLVKAADTGLTREALSMARHLLSLHTAKKRKELAQLEVIDAGSQSFQAQPDLDTNSAMLEMAWEMDWEQFLVEPYLSMFGPDG
ncbi:hypothetical protein G7046_g7805 [Stylonectria norvegica]|nr:hypothetical protein G7046_g7805 [Stylonectria norvegica]